MSKKGRAPSLVTSSAGKPRIVIAKRKRSCKRCNAAISLATVCIEIPIPGAMGRKTYCSDCMVEIIAKSKDDLRVFEEELRRAITT